MSNLETERLKLRELQEWTHWAADGWIQECFDSGHPFRVLEVYRTQARQNKLYAQGRTAPGPVVTMTLKSNHTKRLACDILPDDGDYESIAKIGAKYGITHPLKWDKPHFEFNYAKTQPQPVYSLEAQITRLKRAIGRSIGTTKQMLERALERLLGRA